MCKLLDFRSGKSYFSQPNVQFFLVVCLFVVVVAVVVENLTNPLNNKQMLLF